VRSSPNIAAGSAIVFGGTFPDGTYYNGYFTDAFANWTNTNGTGYLKAGSTNSSGTVFEIQGNGYDSTNVSATYGKIDFTVSADTHGSVAGNVNLIPIGIGCVEISGTCTGTFATQNYAVPPAIGGVTPNAGAFTTLSASNTVSGIGFSNYLASPPAIGGTSANSGSFTTLLASSDLTTDRHVVSGAFALSCSSLAFGSGAGTSPSCNSVTGDDHRFNVSINTGTSPSVATIFTISFANPYSAAPQCLIAPSGGNASVVFNRVYPSSTATTMVLNGDSAALTSSTTYQYNILCTG